MKDGLWAVTFQVGDNVGSGVITKRDRSISGGDAGFAYLGTVHAEGGGVVAHLNIWQHNPGYPNVFPGLTSFQLQLSGKQVDEDSIVATGETGSAPGFTASIGLRFLVAV